MTEVGEVLFGLKVGVLRGPDDAEAQPRGRREESSHSSPQPRSRKREEEEAFPLKAALGDIFLKQGCPT